jgi:hypothetical protein
MLDIAVEGWRKKTRCAYKYLIKQQETCYKLQRKQQVRE